MSITRKTIESATEDKIVIGMVMSTKFIREVRDVYNLDYMKNSFAKAVCAWALNYYEDYEKAPKYQIKDIFDLKREEMEPADVTIIEAFLVKLSKQYSEEQEINEDYFIDKAIEYFEKRELEIRSEQTRKLLEAGKVAEAKEVFSGYKDVEKKTSEIFFPLSTEQAMKVYDDKNEHLLILPGKLGEFLGPFDRGHLFSVVGRFKGGKSFTMQEIVIQALACRLKGAVFSLEMNENDLCKRIYKRLSATTDSDNFAIQSCFDCVSSQDDSCTKTSRIGKTGLILQSGEIPKFSPELQYTPCDVCRKFPEWDRPPEFKLTTWFSQHKKEPHSLKNSVRTIRKFTGMWGNNLAVKAYPRFSATLSDIRRDLDYLEYIEGFIPDVVIIDYAGIIKPERSFSKDYMGLDAIWMSLAGLAEERHCLVVTGSQVERGTLSKKQIESDGLAGWIGQLAHVDMMIALNQDSKEKKRGLVKIAKLADRHKDFNEQDMCHVLQHFGTGQTVLDSEIVREY